MINTPLLLLLLSVLCPGKLLRPASAASIASSPSYSLNISTQNETVVAGNEIRVSVLLKNISNSDIYLTREKSDSRGEYLYDIDVKDKSGASANKTRYLRAVGGEDEHAVIVSAPFVVKIKPGESMKDEIVLNRLFDLTMPGDYLVQVHRNKLHPATAIEGGHDNYDSSNIKSNVLKIRIVE